MDASPRLVAASVSECIQPPRGALGMETSRPCGRPEIGRHTSPKSVLTRGDLSPPFNRDSSGPKETGLGYLQDSPVWSTDRLTDGPRDVRKL